MRIRILDKAERDLADGFNFYEAQRPGLGDRFIDSLLNDIDSLTDFPESYREWFGYRRKLARRFPFAIYFKCSDDGQAIDVYAILDCRRDPERIAERLL